MNEKCSYNTSRYQHTEIYLIESKTFNAYDLERLNEVNQAMNVFIDVERATAGATVEPASSLLQACNMADIYISKIIQFCNSFSAFTSLRMSDRLILLKSFHPEICTIGSAFLYDSHCDGITVNTVNDAFVLVTLKYLLYKAKKMCESGDKASLQMLVYIALGWWE